MFRIALAAACIVATFAAQQAGAMALGCAKHAVFVAHLAKNYAEQPIAIGLASNGGVVEVLSSPGGASWTIIITDPKGAACMVTSGEDWEEIPRHAPFAIAKTP